MDIQTYLWQLDLFNGIRFNGKTGYVVDRYTHPQFLPDGTPSFTKPLHLMTTVRWDDGTETTVDYLNESDIPEILSWTRFDTHVSRYHQ